jgi:hypothetical protein
MTILCAVYTIASIRTNIVLFSILLLLVPCCELTWRNVRNTEVKHDVLTILPMCWL